MEARKLLAELVGKFVFFLAGFMSILLLETIFTEVFVAVILTVTKLNPDRAFIVIPLTLVAIHVALIPITGASVNPARSIAPAVSGGDLTSLWIYIVGPVVGAVGGWAVYRTLLPEPARA